MEHNYYIYILYVWMNEIMISSPCWLGLCLLSSFIHLLSVWSTFKLSAHTRKNAHWMRMFQRKVQQKQRGQTRECSSREITHIHWDLEDKEICLKCNIRVSTTTYYVYILLRRISKWYIHKSRWIRIQAMIIKIEN